MAAQDTVDYAVLITDRSFQILAVTTILISTICVVGRFYIRYIRNRLWCHDDTLCIFAWCCFLATSIGYISSLASISRLYAVLRGDAPIYTTMEDDAAYIPRVLFPTNLLFWTTLWLVKFYLLIQVKKVVGLLRSYLVIWRVIMGYTALVYVGCIICQFLACSSLSGLFRVGACTTERDVFAVYVMTWWAFSADISTDLAIAIFPIPILMKLKLSPRRKWSTIAVFSVGFMSAIVSIARIAATISASGKKEPNIPWQATWGIIEMGTAIIMSCIPAFRMLFLGKAPAKSYPFSDRSAGPRADDVFSTSPSIPTSRVQLINERGEVFHKTGTSTRRDESVSIYSKSIDSNMLDKSCTCSGTAIVITREITVETYEV